MTRRDNFSQTRIDTASIEDRVAVDVHDGHIRTQTPGLSEHQVMYFGEGRVLYLRGPGGFQFASYGGNGNGHSRQVTQVQTASSAASTSTTEVQQAVYLYEGGEDNVQLSLEVMSEETARKILAMSPLKRDLWIDRLVGLPGTHESNHRRTLGSDVNRVARTYGSLNKGFLGYVAPEDPHLEEHFATRDAEGTH